jgi:hypothetical protein
MPKICVKITDKKMHQPACKANRKKICQSAGSADGGRNHKKNPATWQDLTGYTHHSNAGKKLI